MKINDSTLELSDKPYKKIQFKSSPLISKKFKALLAMILETMVSSFYTIIENHTIKIIGITKEIPSQLQDTHLFETKIYMIDELNEEKNPFGYSLLIHTTLVIKKKYGEFSSNILW